MYTYFRSIEMKSLTIFLKIQGEDALNIKNIFDRYIYFWMDISWKLEGGKMFKFHNIFHLRSLFVSYPGSGRSWLRSMFEVNRFSSWTSSLCSNQFGVHCYALISHTRWLCVWVRKTVLTNKAVLQLGKSSDFVRIAVSLRGSPTTQVS